MTLTGLVTLDTFGALRTKRKLGCKLSPQCSLGGAGHAVSYLPCPRLVALGTFGPIDTINNCFLTPSQPRRLYHRLVMLSTFGAQSASSHPSRLSTTLPTIKLINETVKNKRQRQPPTPPPPSPPSPLPPPTAVSYLSYARLVALETFRALRTKAQAQL